MLTEPLLGEIRARFAHVDACPFEGPRVFFENAGGSLTLRAVVERSAEFAAIPDNQGRANRASEALMGVIARARADIRAFLNAPEEGVGGRVFVGESGTELLFRLIRTACVGTAPGRVIGSTLEHPASRSAAARWAGVAGHEHVLAAHDPATATVTAEHYAPHLTPDVRVATIVHTSPVSGIGVDVAGIAAAVREAAPGALIVVDGIQHAAHGLIDVAALGIDGYAISPYKVFSRHGYGVAWASDRLTALPLEALLGGPEGAWELGTRDTGAYATFSAVVDYLDWLGGELSDAGTRRGRIEAAGRAIKAHEDGLCRAAIHGTGNLPGLADMPGVTILGGVENPAREGLVSFAMEGMPAPEIVERLNRAGIRTHTRRADHYSGTVLAPLGLEACVRVSFAHYNTPGEVAAFLSAMREIAAGA